MAIDKSRAKQFEQDVLALQDRLGFDLFYESFEEKLFEYIARQVEAVEKPLQREIKREIDRMFTPEVAQYMGEILNEFDTALSLVNQHYSDLSVDDVTRDFGKLTAIEKITQTRLGEYKRSTANEVSKILRTGLREGERFRTISRRIARIGGKVSNYAATIGKTSVKGYSRASKHQKARIGEVHYHEYVGIVRPGRTRPFCLLLVGTTHHIKSIRQMRNGNLEPVETYCGGWNCNHDWEPDPFAQEASDGSWQEVSLGNQKVKVFTPGNASKEFENG